MKLELIDTPTWDDRAAIAAPLAIFNRANGPDAASRTVALLLKDVDGQTVGGLWGKTVYDWLFIELLAVPESARGRGLGAACVQAAEAWAIEWGSVGAWLDTYAFQARPFYEKLGYTVFGQIEDHPKGSVRYFLKKRFL